MVVGNSGIHAASEIYRSFAHVEKIAWIEKKCKRGIWLPKSHKKRYIINMGKEKKPKKETTFKENLGKLMLDLGKLVFGGMFIAGILRGELPQTTIIISGLALAIIGFVLGLLWTTKDKKTIENKE